MVELGRFDGNMLLLMVYDDGVGLPHDLDPENTQTLGLQLVFDLARQLFGSVAVERPAGGGTCFRVLFPVTEDIELEFDHESTPNPHR
jgi:two-component sensor histidine kinase